MNDAETKAHRAGFVAIVGRPSAGKSTLLNALCGRKVAIISPVPQTTRNRVRGIVTTDAGQLVFVDTPGFHRSDQRLNQHMRGLIEETIRESDAICYVIDTARAPGEEEGELLALVAKRSGDMPAVVVLNKIDVAKPAMIEQVAEWVGSTVPDARIFRTAAITGDGLTDLRDTLIALMPEDDPLYPSDFYTDQDPEFRVSEIIREKAIAQTRKELPHALYVEVADMEERETEKGPQLWIRAFILVERNSQRGIVVGKAGSRIKEIRQSAQREIASLFPYRIHLDLRVKVSPKWRRDERVLKRLIT
jgi:GTP-binding protein Era